MKKVPIGILDGGYEGINIFSNLCKMYPNESYIYINDVKNYPYEGKSTEDILSFVKKSVETLLSYEVGSIICVSASIHEYCSEYLSTLEVKYVSIVDSIIDYVNTNFDQKNMILLGKGYILKANMFQKNFRYNHLYNIPSDVLEKIIFEKKTKTAFSFQKVRETFHTIINKPIDLLIIIDSFLNNLNLEIKEYINAGTTLSLETILMDGLLDLGLETYTSGKGKKIILSHITKKEFKENAYWLVTKYKYVDLDADENKLNKKNLFAKIKKSRESQDENFDNKDDK